MRINQNKIIKLQLIFCLFSTCSSILVAQEKERRNEILQDYQEQNNQEII